MIATSSSPHRQAGDGPGDIDRLLSTFFRGEAPSPWPALSAPVKTPARRHGAGSLSAGRMALAASVAALLAGGWYVSGRLSGPMPPSGSLDNGAATVPANLRMGGNQPTPRHR